MNSGNRAKHCAPTPALQPIVLQSDTDAAAAAVDTTRLIDRGAFASSPTAAAPNVRGPQNDVVSPHVEEGRRARG